MDTIAVMVWVSLVANYAAVGGVLVKGLVRTGGVAMRMRILGGLVVGCGVTTAISRLMRTPDVAHDVCAGVCLLLSTALMLWTWRSLRHVTPRFAFSRHVPGRLVVVGPYRWIRHPLYTSYMVGGAGSVLASGSLAVAAGVLVLASLYIAAARLEEEDLAGAGVSEQYQAYRRRTGMFLPRLVRARSSARA